MDEGERIKWQEAAVNVRRAAFLSHIEYCETCRTHLRGAISGRAPCRELVPILRAYDQAQAFLAELLLPTPRRDVAAARASARQPRGIASPRFSIAPRFRRWFDLRAPLAADTREPAPRADNAERVPTRPVDRRHDASAPAPRQAGRRAEPLGPARTAPGE